MLVHCIISGCVSLAMVIKASKVLTAIVAAVVSFTKNFANVYEPRGSHAKLSV